jgi:hypothetical protein
LYFPDNLLTFPSNVNCPWNELSLIPQWKLTLSNIPQHRTRIHWGEIWRRATQSRIKVHFLNPVTDLLDLCDLCCWSVQTGEITGRFGSARFPLSGVVFHVSGIWLQNSSRHDGMRIRINEYKHD